MKVSTAASSEDGSVPAGRFGTGVGQEVQDLGSAAHGGYLHRATVGLGAGLQQASCGFGAAHAGGVHQRPGPLTHCVGFYAAFEEEFEQRQVADGGSPSQGFEAVRREIAVAAEKPSALYVPV